MGTIPTTSTLLTWMVFTPAIGLGIILCLLALQPATKLGKATLDQASRIVALAAGGVVLVLGVVLYAGFDGARTDVQFVHHAVWIRSFNIEYFVGADGTSVAMILLTALISFVAIVASMPWWGHVDDHHFSKRAVPGYMALILLLECGMIGVFVSLDLFLFYVFWELMLLPMYFLIGVWGGPRKEYAAIKFFLYTFAGSVLLLIAMIALYYGTDPKALGLSHFTLADGTAAKHTFNLVAMAQLGSTGHFGALGTLLGLPFDKVVWVLAFIAFAIKIPMVPFHTWLPDAHVEAPTPISVILAGVLLKMGGYEILRLNFPVLPEATGWAAPGMAAFGAVSIVYAAFVCLAQKDLKKMIAYSSVSHMGFVLLGMAAFTPEAINGAVLQMWNHGIISPMLFLIAGVVYDRAHHREIAGFGGLAKQMPEYTALVGLAFMASLGLPGLAGFISEALVFIGAFNVYTVLTSISILGIIITAAYYLWAMQRMFLGPLNPKYEGLPDLHWRERITLYPLAAIVVVMGLWPAPILDLIRPTLTALVAPLRAFGG